MVIFLTPEDADKVQDITSADKVLVRYDGTDGRKDETMSARAQVTLETMFRLYMNLYEGSLQIDESMPAGIGNEKQWWVKPAENS